MSKPRRCNTCGGCYLPVQGDGSQYYHACPPLVDPITGESSERLNKRDENVTLTPSGARAGIKAEGAGAVEL
jgi:hypothetical protein